MKKYSIVFMLLFALGCSKENFQITDKAYVSEHIVHVTEDNKLVKKYIPQKFYIFHETGFTIQRCQVTKETWLEVKTNQKINLNKIFDCIYGAEASIRIIKAQ